MELSPLKYDENAWHCSIVWSQPRRIPDYLKEPKDQDASLYVILSKNKKKILYLGMTHKQFAVDRIKEHGYKKGFVSVGAMKAENYGKITRQRVEDTESLLIYFYTPTDNSTKDKWIALKQPTLVENKGFSYFFPRYLYYGMCISKCSRKNKFARL